MSQEVVRSGTEGQGTSDSPREQLFSQFYDVTDFQEILATFRALCEEIGIDPSDYGLYSLLKGELTSWKARALWQLLDGRARLPEYGDQKACEGKRVLVVGAGPVGLRAAIEAALLGARVDVVEKRKSFSRNNSLHLWPFLITDLRNLGAKKFYGKFASGTIDHICIRILQGVLLKVCLLLGVKIHSEVKFTGLVEPKNTNSGWTVTVTPTSCPISSYHFDVIIAADGKQNSLPGFHSKEFRAKLALAITANFVNSNTQAENSVPEISGVAYIYSQDFFKSLSQAHGIELENIVYYKDETHYFVMTAKKTSLLKKGVLKKDCDDPKQLLLPGNCDNKALERYAIEAAAFSTDGALGDVKFAKNHKGKNDVALFDFTSLFASENAARIVERKGKRILLCVVGDSLIEPFWPTGSGCARGFLGVFDAAWMMKRFSAGDDPIEILEEREAILYLLPQTTPERLHKNHSGYTIDPKTRYPNLNELVPPGDISHLYDTDTEPRPARSVKKSDKTGPRQAPEKPAIGDKPSHSPAIVRASTVSGWLPKSRSIEGLDLRAFPADRSFQEPPAHARPALSHFPKLWPWEKKKEVDTKAKAQSTKASESRKTHQKTEVKPTDSKALEKKQPSPTGTKVERSAAESSSGGKKLDVAESGKTHTPKDDRTEEETQRPVAEIIKRLDPSSQQHHQQQSAAAAGHVFGKGKGTPKQQKSPKQESKKASKAKPKPSKAEKEKQKEKPPKEDKRKKAAKPEKEPSHTHWWHKFLKSKRTYEVSATQQVTLPGGRGSPKHDKKKSKKEEKKTEVLAEPKPLTVQERIEQLQKRTGVDSADAASQEFTEEQQEMTITTTTTTSTTTTEGEETLKKEPSPEPQFPDTPEHKPGKPMEEAPRMIAADSEPEVSKEPVDKTLATQEPGKPMDDEPEREPLETEHELEVRSKLSPERKTPEPEEPTTSKVEESIKKLQPFFEAKTQETSWKRLSDKRSKEVDLADIYKKETVAEGSNPLWLAKVKVRLNKCLERLKKENDVSVAKNALEILNTIFSNVQNYPEDDTYRRVRLSSKSFHNNVWQYDDASQFLARSGWVEIDDFIVLPIGKKVDVPKQVLDKHLNIVNQMLWSMQLELPDSPSIVTRRPLQFRLRSSSLCRKESYASRVVFESLERVDKERVAMAAAARSRKRTTSGSTSPLSPVSELGEREPSPGPFESVPHHRVEEAQTIKAASAARNIWMKKDTARQRLETELYDLEPSPRKFWPVDQNSRSEGFTSPSRIRSPDSFPLVVATRSSNSPQGVPLSEVPEEPEGDSHQKTDTTAADIPQKINVVAAVESPQKPETSGINKFTGLLDNGDTFPQTRLPDSPQKSGTTKPPDVVSSPEKRGWSSSDSTPRSLPPAGSQKGVWEAALIASESVRQQKGTTVNNDPKVQPQRSPTPENKMADRQLSPRTSASPIPMTASLIPTAASPIPTAASPIPTTASLIPTAVSPIPSPIPTTATPIPTAASPILTTASPIPTAASPIPTTASPIPMAASPIPMTASPIPMAASPIPTAASPIPTAASPTAKESTATHSDAGPTSTDTAGGGEEEKEPGSPQAMSDAQSATISSIRSDLFQYEKMAMEQAAQARQRWVETAEVKSTSETSSPSP